MAQAGTPRDWRLGEDPAPVDFTSQVRPILSDRCFPCHGPDAGALEADLRLDLRASALEDRGGYAVIVPGDPEASELVYRIHSDDEDERMPPAEANSSLQPHEIDLLTRWVAEGAPYAKHWSFERPDRHVAPEVQGVDWVQDPLDRFVLAKLEESGMQPTAEADRATLLRRVSYDLTGLPPTLAQLDAFLADRESGAWERVVDRLLASPPHAERLAADWLDVARYADTFGYQSDVEMNVWPWRDWVLEAFAANMPYDDFLTQQLAGDLMPAATQSSRLATTFNRLHRQTNEGGSVEEEFRVSYVADRVETMSAAFLGLTVGCAQCHDHRFDPFPQREYYQLSSFFDDIDESGLYSHFTASVPTPALDLPDDEQQGKLAALDVAILEMELQIADYRDLPGQGAGPVGRFRFEQPDVTMNSIEGAASAKLVDGPAVVAREQGFSLQMSGEDAVSFPGIGDFRRSDPFSIALDLSFPDYERAVVIHKTKSWTDSGSRGYQLLVESGHLTFALVHFWPGDAIAIRTSEPVATDTWQQVAVTYDGSSRASGLALFIDGEAVEVEVVRDHLTRTIRGGSIGDLTIGSRFRDKGYKGGLVDNVGVWPRQLSGQDVASLFRTGEVGTGLGTSEVDDLGEALRTKRAERDTLRDQVRQIMTMATAPDLAATQRTTYLLDRGDYSSPTEAVGPGLPSAFPSLGFEAAEDRLDLAQWMTHPDHPTTARIAVGRLWRVAFGNDLLTSPEDIGSQGTLPTHRKLLDTLARDLVDSGWDTRTMLRRFVLSSTYRQGSYVETAAEVGELKVDPDNVLFGRAQRGRLSAEMIRDGAMHAAGLLSLRQGGPPVFPYQPPGLWREKSGRTYPVGKGEDLHRRSLYTFWKRTSPPPTMTMFDTPSREVCTVARQSTTTPLQVLALWNDPQYVEVAVVLAEQAVAAAESDTERITFLMRALTSRLPTDGERATLLELLISQRRAYGDDVASAHTLASFDFEAFLRPPAADAVGENTVTPLSDSAAIERAALATVASTLLSLDAAVTRR